eukprot:CAMPEP_0174858594 /NCGR_PEP_ID=MMETSP1114-20130205/43261_1 /TAXON_ID=312471 /ORGANISM="Neobodo designis, Strain CCAP 1951/1" /LENGTH=59 /DNA_ID=CAMNT_0016093505 /DNA_START=20 /DNA_END=195 /DNA_ORIENTATION=+
MSLEATMEAVAGGFVGPEVLATATRSAAELARATGSLSVGALAMAACSMRTSSTEQSIT